MTKKQLLENLKFGERIAEDEKQELTKYFVSTESWRKIKNGDTDIVFGAKGCGKSAVYVSVTNNSEELFRLNRVLTISAENPRGETVFKNLVSDPPTSELEFIGLWKLYILALVIKACDEQEYEHKNLVEVKKALESIEIIPKSYEISRIFSRAVAKMKMLFERGAPEIDLSFDDNTGAPKLGLSIVAGEPTSEQERLGYRSIDYFLGLANRALNDLDSETWILVDRLDVAFLDSPEVEANGIRALFKVYLDFKKYESINLKIFLRDDIWRSVTKSGFREMSHITRYINIVWSEDSLMNLVLYRLLNNSSLIEYYGIDKDEVLSSIEKQRELFYRLFPKQVDVGAKKRRTFQWILSRLRDGKGVVAPREVIHLLNAATHIQLNKLQIGRNDIEGDQLLSRQSIREAMDQVSSVRIEQTIYPENPSLKPYIEKLRGEKAENSRGSLRKIWGTDDFETSEAISGLVDIGIFEERGSKVEPKYWVPFLYRPGLGLIQGSSDES